MQIITFLSTTAVFIASAAAQSATTGGAVPTSTSSAGGDLDSVVSQLPQCAITCLDSTASSIGCSASDLTCLCSNSDKLISSIGPCILLSSGCSSEEQSRKLPPQRTTSYPLSCVPLKTTPSGFRGYNPALIHYVLPTHIMDQTDQALFPPTEIQSLAGSLCNDVSSANSAELASASNYINSAIATGTTATAAGSTPTSASGNAAARTDSPIAGMGAMGAAAALAVLAL